MRALVWRGGGTYPRLTPLRFLDTALCSETRPSPDTPGIRGWQEGLIDLGVEDICQNLTMLLREMRWHGLSDHLAYESRAELIESLAPDERRWDGL